MALSHFNPTLAEAEPMTLYGAGASPCRNFSEIFDAFRPFLNGAAHDLIAQRATANFLQYEEWIDGYIFGMETNMRSTRALRDWDQASASEWIYGFGQKHPSDIVANAALAFFKTLSGASVEFPGRAAPDTR
jgi:hypothetical protein